MAGRRPKRMILRLVALLLLLLVLGGVAAWRWWLPGFVARRITTAMQEHGVVSPALEIRSLGLYSMDATNLHAAGPGWELSLQRLRTHHRPLELLTPRVAAVELDGLRTTLTPEDWPRTGAVRTNPPSQGPLLADLPSAWPVGELLVTNAILRLRHHDRERVWPFWTRLHTVATNGGLNLLFASRTPTDLFRLEGELARDRDSTVNLDFDLHRPGDWTDLLLASEPAVPQPFHLGRLSGRVRFEVPAGGDALSATLGLAPWTAVVPAGRLALTNTRANLTAGRGGLGAVELATGLRFAGTNGLTAAAPSLRLSLATEGRLDVAVPEFSVTLGDNLKAHAGCALAIPNIHAGADARGQLTIALETWKAAGWEGDSGEVHLRGSRKELRFEADSLRATGPVVVLLREVSGRLREPLSPRQELEISGRLSVEAPGQVAGLTPLPFHLQAHRESDRLDATWSLAFTNLHPSLANGLELPGLRGTIAAEVSHHTNRTEARLRLGAGLPRLETPVARAEDLTLTGVVQAAIAPGPRLVLPAVLCRLLALSEMPGDVQAWPAQANGWLSLHAKRLHLPGGSEFSDAELRLERTPKQTGGPETWASVSGQAASWDFAGLHLPRPRVEIALRKGAITLEGQVSPDGRPAPFRVTVRPADVDDEAVNSVGDAPPGLDATFHLGPIDLADFAPPPELMGGAEVRLNGRLEVAGQARWQPDGALQVAPTLTLDLARVELPAQDVVFEHLAGRLDLASVNPPLSATNATFTIGRVAWTGREATNLTLRVQALARNRLRVELDRADIFGGRMWTEPFLISLPPEDLAVHLHLADLDLGRLSQEIPHFAGRLEGRIGGVLSVRHADGRWRPNRSRLELNSGVPASVAYPAEGLLTGGLPPDSARYEQLRLVEEGLKHLTLQSLRVDVVPPDHPETLARIQLAGTSISPRAIVPIVLNLNLNGDLEALLDVLNRGTFEFSF